MRLNFRELVVVLTNKPVAPLALKGKQYNWELVKTSADIIDLDKQYSGADFAAAFALAEIRSDNEVKTFLSMAVMMAFVYGTMVNLFMITGFPAV